MLGCGVVGGSVARELASNSSDLAARAGAKLELSKIAVRTITCVKYRETWVERRETLVNRLERWIKRRVT